MWVVLGGGRVWMYPSNLYIDFLSSIKIWYAFDVLRALKKKLLLTMSKGHTRVVLKTDCQAVYDAWHQHDRSMGGSIFREKRTYLPNLQGFEICRTGRDANVAAHTCAKESLAFHTSSIVCPVIPDFLLDIVQPDLVHQNE